MEAVTAPEMIWTESSGCSSPLSPSLNSSSAFTFGLPSPISAKKPSPPNAILNGNPIRLNFVLGKRKADALYDLDEVPRLSLSPAPFPPSTTAQNEESELREAVSKALSPPMTKKKRNIFSWDDITFQHSDDEEDENSDRKDAQLPEGSSSTLSDCPTSTPQRSFSSSPTLDTVIFAKQDLLSSKPLDPGILAFVKINKNNTTRTAYRYDPYMPRPSYATTPTFGHLPGLYVGKKWHSRMGAAWDGTHLAIVGGISGKEGTGVWSIALSGGYEDDFDEGYRFVYTGSGGRSTKNGNSSKGQQSKDQDWNPCNKALRENVMNEKPIRVIRGYKGDKKWSPPSGFMYCGLYEVVACWIEKGKSGFDIIRFAFRRLPDQAPLVDGQGNIAPEPDYDSEEWKGWMLRLTDERADEILATKKEESPVPEDLIRMEAELKKGKESVVIKIED